ncbi:MAG: UDP-glucose/GDP-mannose dehydrogenase family protein [Candidatus Woesearchaeota archaeon]
MNLSVFGVGYVGLVTGACLSDLGNKVICVDSDKNKIDLLNNGGIPIYEAGLAEIVERNFNAKRLEFTTATDYAVNNSDIIFLCVGTPPMESGDVDLKYLDQAVIEISHFINDYKILVNKSTVPVGTADRVKMLLQKYLNSKVEFDVVSNPEFLREGSAVKDFQNPDRIIIGSTSKRAIKTMKLLYESVIGMKNKIIVVDVRSAELSKYASNSFLATKISFINEMAHWCEKTGADIQSVALCMGLDNRIGPEFLKAGVGYGGSCFPKDVKGAIYMMENVGLTADILRSVEKVNNQQKKIPYLQLKAIYGSLHEKNITIWGVAFKPDTDDIREASALTLIELLLKDYANITIHDPIALPNIKKFLSSSTIQPVYSEDMYESVRGADALVIMTDWKQFKQPDLNKIKEYMNRPVIIDGRNIYDKQNMLKLGFEYHSIGR